MSGSARKTEIQKIGKNWVKSTIAFTSGKSIQEYEHLNIPIKYKTNDTRIIYFIFTNRIKKYPINVAYIRLSKYHKCKYGATRMPFMAFSKYVLKKLSPIKQP